MGIWIRSQNKEILCNTNTVTILECINMSYRIVNSDISMIGEYSSKEKAMKVLDMIQSHFLNKELMDLGLATSFQNDDIVFQMPQDDGV